MAKPSQATTQNILGDAIEKIRRADATLTIQGLAKSGGVATSAVVAVRNNTFPGPKKEVAGASERARRGWAETLSRLTNYANRRLNELDGAYDESKPPVIDVKEVLLHFGLDPKDTEVARAMLSVAEQSGVDGVVTDSVLKQIALRSNKVKVGLIRWPPFFKWQQEANKSWAYRYTSRLVGSVNPYWDIEEEVRDSFGDTVNQMGAGSPDFDLLFGAYNTPYRRLRGLDFIDMPGLAVPLALVVSDPHIKTDRLWNDLLNSDSKLWRSGTFLTLPGEVGELFLKGPCRIDKEQVKTAEKVDGSLLERGLEQIVYQFHDLVSQNSGPTLLCADRAFCTALREKARSMMRTEQSETSKFCSALQLVDTDPLLTPRYKLGIAVRADSARWSDLLRDAQVTELFGNAIGQTAAAYVELLLSAKDEIEVVELVSSLGEARARRFVQLCSVEVKRQSETRPPGDEKLEDIRDRHLPRMLGMAQKESQTAFEREKFEKLVKEVENYK